MRIWIQLLYNLPTKIHDKNSTKDKTNETKKQVENKTQMEEDSKYQNKRGKYD